jgi:hypothetical protein
MKLCVCLNDTLLPMSLLGSPAIPSGASVATDHSLPSAEAVMSPEAMPSRGVEMPPGNGRMPPKSKNRFRGPSFCMFSSTSTSTRPSPRRKLASHSCTGLPATSGGITTPASEKLEICAVTLSEPKTALGTCSHCVCELTVLNSCGVRPAGTVAGSKGSVMVTGNAKFVPCGVSAKVWPAMTKPEGNAGAPAEDCSMLMRTSAVSAPAGMTMLVPAGPLTVPPAAPMTVPAAGGGGGGAGGADSSPPPQDATSPHSIKATARRTMEIRFMRTPARTGSVGAETPVINSRLSM